MLPTRIQTSPNTSNSIAIIFYLSIPGGIGLKESAYVFLGVKGWVVEKEKNSFPIRVV